MPTSPLDRPTWVRANLPRIVADFHALAMLTANVAPEDLLAELDVVAKSASQSKGTRHAAKAILSWADALPYDRAYLVDSFGSVGFMVVENDWHWDLDHLAAFERWAAELGKPPIYTHASDLRSGS